MATLAGRKSILKLAQRMTSSFCRAIGASSYNIWTKVSGKTGEDIRIASRKNLNDPGEPLGLILCAVSSVWLPISPHVLFDFLRDESRRNEVCYLLHLHFNSSLLKKLLRVIVLTILVSFLLVGHYVEWKSSSIHG